MVLRALVRWSYRAERLAAALGIAAHRIPTAIEKAAIDPTIMSDWVPVSKQLQDMQVLAEVSGALLLLEDIVGAVLLEEETSTELETPVELGAAEELAGAVLLEELLGPTAVDELAAAVEELELTTDELLGAVLLETVLEELLETLLLTALLDPGAVEEELEAAIDWPAEVHVDDVELTLVAITVAIFASRAKRRPSTVMNDAPVVVIDATAIIVPTKVAGPFIVAELPTTHCTLQD